MKKRISILLIVTFILLNTTIALANPLNNTEILLSNKDFKAVHTMAYSDDKTYSQLIEIGFTNQEILDLFQRESNVTGIKLKLPDKLKQIMNIDFVTPDVSERIHSEDFILYANNGDIRYQNYSINFDRIARNLGWAGGGYWCSFYNSECFKKSICKGGS